MSLKPSKSVDTIRGYTSYGLGGPMMTVAMLSLALNLVLTGAFIALVKHLVARPPSREPARGGEGALS
jgi:hypothetical protein